MFRDGKMKKNLNNFQDSGLTMLKFGGGGIFAI